MVTLYRRTRRRRHKSYNKTQLPGGYTLYLNGVQISRLFETVRNIINYVHVKNKIRILLTELKILFEKRTCRTIMYNSEGRGLVNV